MLRIEPEMGSLYLDVELHRMGLVSLYEDMEGGLSIWSQAVISMNLGLMSGNSGSRATGFDSA